MLAYDPHCGLLIVSEAAWKRYEPAGFPLPEIASQPVLMLLKMSRSPRRMVWLYSLADLISVLQQAH